MSSSSPSSSRTIQALHVQAPDSTYRSLISLLSSPALSASSHLDLIPANGLSASITHYLSTLPVEDAAQFAKLLASSNALWSTSLILERATLVFEAAARSVLGRIDVIIGERKGSLNWSSRRALVTWFRAIADAIHLDKESVPTACSGNPLSTLALHTGLLAGLQAAKAQRKQNQDRGLDVRSALARAEDEWCISLAECLEPLAGQISSLPHDDWEVEFRKASLTSGAVEAKLQLKTTALYLAAQAAPFVPSKKLAALPGNVLISVLSDSMLRLFEESKVLDSIREDITQNDAGQLLLKADSPTASNTAAFASNPLYSLMGPLSRILSLALSNVTRTMQPLQVQEMLIEKGGLLARMQKLAHQWQTKWLSCRLAGASEEDIDAASKSQVTQLWGAFKTLLFSYTMIFDALMEAIVDSCPSPTITLKPTPESISSSSGRWPPSTISNIPATYLLLTKTILLTYSHLSWITSTFGSTAFDAFRRVFYEALEVLVRDEQACVNLVELLAPERTDSSLQDNRGRRAAVTYYFDVVEQSMVALPDEMVVNDILPFVEEYLGHAEHQDSFESSHSVVLSIFATQKSCVCELTPYYIDLLLQNFPKHLQEDQLLHTYSTVINATSDKSDTVTWYSLEVLWKEIEDERRRISKEGKDTEKGTESATRRRQLSYVYVAQIPNINLVLLRSLLAKVKSLILQEEASSEERSLMCGKVFDCMGELDASTREEGLRWWLEERKAFGV
ncbi:hypothetical protein CBS101457_004776 [Exobasidium rhododendri]|nr:hypothetical protein CBS101457_004776 [Exobasidium rhododendri]